MLTEQRDSKKRAVSPEEPVESIFQAKEHHGKNQNDDSSFGHVEFEETFIYPDGDIQVNKICGADAQQSLCEKWIWNYQSTGGCWILRVEGMNLGKMQKVRKAVSTLVH